MKYLTNKTVLLVLFFVSLSFYGCKTESYLSEYLKEHKYEPFTIARQGWGIGTIMRFDKNGGEHIASFKDQCLKAVKPRWVPVTLLQKSYTINKNNEVSLEAELAKKVDQTINFDALFTSKRVKKVVINIGDAREYAISDTDIEDIMETLSGSCIDKLNNPKNTTISRVLEVGYLEYTFYDEKNRVINLDVDLLSNINFRTNNSKNFVGNSSLKIENRTLIGYRFRDFDIEHGMTKTKVTMSEEYTLEDIKKIKSR